MDRLAEHSKTSLCKTVLQLRICRLFEYAADRWRVLNGHDISRGTAGDAGTDMAARDICRTALRDRGQNCSVQFTNITNDPLERGAFMRWLAVFDVVDLAMSPRCCQHFHHSDGTGVGGFDYLPACGQELGNEPIIECVAGLVPCGPR